MQLFVTVFKHLTIFDRLQWHLSSPARHTHTLSCSRKVSCRLTDWPPDWLAGWLVGWRVLRSGTLCGWPCCNKAAAHNYSTARRQEGLSPWRSCWGLRLRQLTATITTSHVTTILFFLNALFAFVEKYVFFICPSLAWPIAERQADAVLRFLAPPPLRNEWGASLPEDLAFSHSLFRSSRWLLLFWPSFADIPGPFAPVSRLAILMRKAATGGVRGEETKKKKNQDQGAKVGAVSSSRQTH